jgi:hypothetical protein
MVDDEAEVVVVTLQVLARRSTRQTTGPGQRPPIPRPSQLPHDLFLPPCSKYLVFVTYGRWWDPVTATLTPRVTYR